jgi:hypothetical protein
MQNNKQSTQLKWVTEKSALFCYCFDEEVRVLQVNPKTPADLIAQRTRVKKSGIRLFEQVSGIHRFSKQEYRSGDVH